MAYLATFLRYINLVVVSKFVNGNCFFPTHGYLEICNFTQILNWYMKIQSIDYLLIALEMGSAILIQYRYYNTVQAVTTQDLSADIANSSQITVRRQSSINN